MKSIIVAALAALALAGAASAQQCTPNAPGCPLGASGFDKLGKLAAETPGGIIGAIPGLDVTAADAASTGTVTSSAATTTITEIATE